MGLPVLSRGPRSWCAPYSARLRTSSSSVLTSVKGTEDKGYEKLPPLDESVIRATLALTGRACALYSMAFLQAFQAKLLAGMDESALDSATLTELRRSMASLVVLERHLWLTLTEIKDADKVPFLDATGLFGPAVEGFTEYFSAVQKTSQAMQHFLPKRSSSAAASGRLKSVPPQQPVKPAPAATAASAQPAKPEPRQRSRSARCYPFPKCQRPRPACGLWTKAQAGVHMPRDAGSVSSSSVLLARSERTPRAGPLGQHDGGVLYESPGGTFLQAPLHFSGGPSGVGSAVPSEYVPTTKRFVSMHRVHIATTLMLKKFLKRLQN
ncbi:hypothetical protein M9458_056056 [Cirrhinus mrigala]|uniref:Uncharacterized protein n=1 Tax=Cirrhinus mrigala TaxID=683832 RepID=A0ABD0MIH7_CIRMR